MKVLMFKGIYGSVKDRDDRRCRLYFVWSACHNGRSLLSPRSQNTMTPAHYDTEMSYLVYTNQLPTVVNTQLCC